MILHIKITTHCLHIKKKKEKKVYPKGVVRFLLALEVSVSNSFCDVLLVRLYCIFKTIYSSLKCVTLLTAPDHLILIHFSSKPPAYSSKTASFVSASLNTALFFLREFLPKVVVTIYESRLFLHLYASRLFHAKL
jgi:hypothetical protein